MKIYITGYMGSGKTTVAKKLASSLNYQYIDLDEVIERETKSTIAELFEKEGEDSFRLKEQHALRRTEGLDKAVISTGGGTPCFFDNMDWMNEEGITVYLEAPAGLLFHRLLHEKDKRPLLKKIGEIQLMEHIQEHLAQREQYYKKALLTVKAASLNVSLLKEKVQKAALKRAKKKSA